MSNSRTKKVLTAILSLVCTLSFAFAFGCNSAPQVSIELDKTAVTLQTQVWDTDEITADIGESDGAVTWTSSDTSVVEVNDGSLQARGEGTATVTATIGDASATCTVTVLAYAPQIAISETDVSVKRTENVTVTVSVTSHEKTCPNVSVAWRSSDDGIATVDGGTISGVSVGTATVTATTSGLGEGSEKTATVAVTVTEKIVSCTIEHYFNDGTGDYVINDAETETKEVALGANVSASYKVYSGYSPAKTAEGTLASGEASASGLVLKLYYDNAVAIGNTEGKGYINALTTGFVYSDGFAISKVTSEFNGKSDVFKVTQSKNDKNGLLISGISPDYVSGNGYKTLVFNLYVDSENLSKNYVINTNVGGIGTFSIHTSDYKNKATSIVKFTDADGNDLSVFEADKWITVTVDISRIGGKTNPKDCIFLQWGAGNAATCYIQGATLSASEYVAPSFN